MAKYVLTVTSRTGEKVNQINGEPWESLAVYDTADLNRRLKAIARDPRNLKAAVEKVRG